MYWQDTQKHNLPHFHARHSGTEAVFTLEGDCIQGTLGRRAEYLIKEWCKEKREEIHNAWQKAVKGEEVPWISPIQ